MNELPSEAWWTAYQLELVEDRTRTWRAERFQPVESVEVESGGQRVVRKRAGEADGGGKVVPGGWDHEHCELCWRTISTAAGHDAVGMTDGRAWVCLDCYGKFIRPRELEYGAG